MIAQSPKFLRNSLVAISASLALFTAATSSSAIAQDPTIRAGTLTCKGQGSVGLILGSSERLDCTYAPAGNRPRSRYNGQITRIGLDIGVRGKSVMVWTVLGSTSALPGEALGGTFVGANADASLGLGAGAKVLVGGNKKSVVLQPLSVNAQTGVNLALGVSGLKLVPR